MYNITMNKSLNILLVYPKYPETFWGFKYAINFISKKAVHPPLGLMTVASLLPKGWKLKLVDMNAQKLKDKDIENSDYVFMSAMAVQKNSVKEIIARCQHFSTKVVAGGPLFTASHEDIKGVDHFILNEAEVTLPLFLKDLEQRKEKHIYTSSEFSNIENTPAPRWDLVKMKKYVSMNIQYSRGCPFNCDFCDITILFGKGVRTKTKNQILSEFDRLYALGWRENVFFVDDNFIGNTVKLKNEILPAMLEWQKAHKFPFTFTTEASMNLSDDEKLMSLMVETGFETVFLGIETPDEESLLECGKFQNKNRNLVDSIKKIRHFGLDVTGGFIVGFDNDTPSIFQRQIELIQNSGIITAMVGLLNAPKNTKLYKRLKEEGRLLSNASGSNTDFSINFKSKMDKQALIDGYKKIIENIYSAKPYYERIIETLKEKNKTRKKRFQFKFVYVKAMIKSMILLGIKDKGRKYYWKLLFWSLFKRPGLLPFAMTLYIQGFHFRKIFML